VTRRALVLATLALAAAPALAVAGDGTDKKKKSGGVSYIPLETLTGTTSKAGGRHGVLTVECGLDVPDGALRARAEESLPRLRAAYLQTVMVYAAGLPMGAPPSADWLGATLQRETDQALGRPGAKLLLGAILVN
jgi:hypothetical protein